VNSTKNAGRWTVAALSALVFLAPLKFGMPVVMQSTSHVPRGLLEWVLSPWPNPLLVMLVFAGLIWFAVSVRNHSSRDCGIRASGAEPSKQQFDLLYWLPLAWLLTQMAATPRSISVQTSVDTVLHFAVCVVVFYAAARYVRDEKAAGWVFGALAAATALVCIAALQQRFGGLAATREYAAAYLDPATISDDLRLKLTSNRVFGTLAYPNALAGYLVVAFVPVLAWLWGKVNGRVTKAVMLAAAGGLMVFCLVLTGSRGGFAALAVSVMAGVLCLAPRNRMSWLVIGVVALATLAVVFAAAQRGGLMHLRQSSLGARLDYWSGAARIAHDHPWFGTGPGTFGSVYTKYKTATTEEAQLVHNSYLEMWCDSGVAAFAVFVALWVVAVGAAFRLVRPSTSSTGSRQAGSGQGGVVSVAVYAALVGWTVHGLVDFDLYVPGVAVPAFALLGILHGLTKDRRQETGDRIQEINHRQPLMLAAVVILALAVMWFEGRMLAANLAHEKSLGSGTDWTAAVTAAERAAALAPRNPIYQMTAGELLVSAGQFAEGLGYCRRAVENDPLRASCHYRLAGALAAAGRPVNEVSRELRRAVELNPTKAQYREILRLVEENR
jgi:O-antigen ligase